jgi:hypothetical protein
MQRGIKISAVTRPDGKLALGFSWQEGIVDDAILENIQGQLEYAVMHLQDEEPLGCAD